MPNLLSFICEIERNLSAESTLTTGPKLSSSRMVSYHLLRARAILSLDGKEVGSVFLQRHDISEGAFCIEVTMSWTNTQQTKTHMVFSEPAIDLEREAAGVATMWNNGPMLLAA